MFRSCLDSDKTPFDMGAWSSRGTHYTGHAALARPGFPVRSKPASRLAAAQLGAEDVPGLEAGRAWSRRRQLSLAELVQLDPATVGGVLTVDALLH